MGFDCPRNRITEALFVTSMRLGTSGLWKVVCFQPLKGNEKIQRDKGMIKFPMTNR
jgi:hypothetical protein